MWRKKENGGLAGCSGSSRPSSILQPDGADGKGTGPPLRLYAAQVLIIPIVYTFDEFPVPTCPSSVVQTFEKRKNYKIWPFFCFRPTNLKCN